MKRHMKRIAAPESWPVKRKGTKFVTRPRSSHGIKLCLPISIIIKDLLGHAKTMVEVKKILSNEQIMVDGKRVKDPKLGVGLMDVLEIAKTKDAYVVMLSKRGKLELVKAQNSKNKICRIIGKRVVKGARLQINLHDGKNIETDRKVNVGDSLVLSLPDLGISEHLALEKGNIIYMTGGKHIGELGQIEDLKRDVIKVRVDDDVFETKRNLAFVVGKETSLINVEK